MRLRYHRRGHDRLAVLIATLCWSRTAYVEFVTERLAKLLGRLERAFYFFGGVPREILWDNMGTVVTDRYRYGHRTIGSQHSFYSVGYEQFAKTLSASP